MFLDLAVMNTTSLRSITMHRIGVAKNRTVLAELANAGSSLPSKKLICLANANDPHMSPILADSAQGTRDLWNPNADLRHLASYRAAGARRPRGIMAPPILKSALSNYRLSKSNERPQTAVRHGPQPSADKCTYIYLSRQEEFSNFRLPHPFFCCLVLPASKPPHCISNYMYLCDGL
jgi:hypothetical protein